jgi:fibronectin-binding autotransporter adhesin
VILGGDGDDILVGGGARDLLIGGVGTDTLSGGSDDDLLLAGTTAFDNDERTLTDIQAEWLSADAYQDRLASLGSLLVTDGLNPTVFDDDAQDMLIGEGDLDAYFANLGAGVPDVILADPMEELFDVD